LDGPIQEYWGWLQKGLRLAARRRAAQAALARIAAHDGPRFLIPLQLDTDFQLRLRGTGRSQQAELELSLRSFRDHAPPDAMLVIKIHPLDNGLMQWDKICERLTHDLDLTERVLFLDGGAIEPLLATTKGVLTINSTVGLAAILAGVPTHVLGQAIYDRAGLTHQGERDQFWTNAKVPDADLARSFGRFLRSNAHVPGSFDGPGVLIGAGNIADFIAKRSA
jgi:capsular polysaccharide export protein